MTPNAWIGKKVGRFIVSDRLASGGMSVVYRAVDCVCGRPVALKVLHDTYAQHMTISARFAQEADLVQMLQHENLVDVYETGKIDGRVYVAFALIDGGSLVHVLESHRRLALGQSIRTLTEIGAVLDYIHSQNVIHRDLKLGNILIDSSNKSYLIDFGISRWLDAEPLTEADFTMPGTARYMPPEQVLGGISFNHRADLYSFGVVAYVLITGYFPFTGINDLVLMNQHLTMRPASPSQINPALPVEVDAVLYKMLSKKAENRYGSAGEFINALCAALADAGDIMVDMHLGMENPGQLLPEYHHGHASIFCDATPVSPQKKNTPDPRRANENTVTATDTGKFRGLRVSL